MLETSKSVLAARAFTVYEYSPYPADTQPLALVAFALYVYVPAVVAGFPAALPCSSYHVTVFFALSLIGNVISSPAQYEGAALNVGALGSSLTVIDSTVYHHLQLLYSYLN